MFPYLLCSDHPFGWMSAHACCTNLTQLSVLAVSSAAKSAPKFDKLFSSTSIFAHFFFEEKRYYPPFLKMCTSVFVSARKSATARSRNSLQAKTSFWFWFPSPIIICPGGSRRRVSCSFELISFLTFASYFGLFISSSSSSSVSFFISSLCLTGSG